MSIKGRSSASTKLDPGRDHFLLLDDDPEDVGINSCQLYVTSFTGSDDVGANDLQQSYVTSTGGVLDGAENGDDESHTAPFEYQFPFQHEEQEWFDLLSVHSSQYYDYNTDRYEELPWLQTIYYCYLPKEVKVKALFYKLSDFFHYEGDVPLLFLIGVVLYSNEGESVEVVMERVLEAISASRNVFLDLETEVYCRCYGFPCSTIRFHSFHFFGHQHPFLTAINFINNNPGFLSPVGILLEAGCKIMNLHRVVSDLNGNNGEVTNSDDHVRVERARRPNLNHLHQRPVPGGRNDPDNFDERPVGNRRNAGRRVAEARLHQPDPAPVVAPRRPKQKIIYCTEEDLGWDGFQFYIYINGTNTCRGLKNGEILPCVTNQFALHTNVFKTDIGYVERYMQELPTDEDLKMTIIRTAWDVITLDGGFVHEGFSFEQKTYKVFTPAMSFLRKKFSSLVISESLVNGMLAGLNREFGTDVDLLPTIQCYVHFAHLTNHRVSREFVTKTKPVIKNRIDESYCSSLRLERSEETVVLFRSMDCNIPDTYIGRTDCCITFGDEKWCGVDNTKFQRDNPDSYPHFLTSEDDANNNKYYRSVYVRFDGVDVSPFVTYSVNAKNAMKALKRMAGARETQPYDHYLTSLQYAAYAEVLNRSEGDSIFGSSIDEYLEVHQDFFSIGRAEVHTSMSQEVGVKVIDKFVVGHKNWRVQENGAVHKLSYVSPYRIRPQSWHIAPKRRSHRSLLQGELYEDVGIVDVFQPGGIYPWLDYIQAKRPALRPWMAPGLYPNLPSYSGDAIELNAVHQMMFEGFTRLRERHCRATIDQYAHDHPDWLYFEGFNNYLTMMDCETDRCWHASIKHVKKALRMMYVENQRVHLPTDIMVKTVNAKVKKEFAKFGKVPRLFVTYDAGCMFANELPEYSKVCLNGSYAWKYGDITASVTVFAKPTTPGLKKQLDKCINAMRMRNHLNILIYSDDSVWSGNINGVDFAFNVDISSCDSGNKLGTFGLVYDLLSSFRQDLAVGLMAQCANDINLVNPENGDECMKIQMATFFEGSGTVLTTILNHVAMYMIGHAAVALFGLRKAGLRSWTDICDLIKECGVCFGHILTVDPCLDGSSFCPEKIQFLKRSPLRTVKGDYVPSLNYGTIFRGFGSLEGDMVAEMVGLSVEEFKVLSWSERWDLFASRVVAGLINEPNSVVLGALRSRYSSTPKHFRAWSEISYANERIQYGGIIEAGSDDSREETIDPVSLARRYGCSIEDLEVLASQIMNSKFGDVYPSDAVSAFAEVDYGVQRL